MPGGGWPCGALTEILTAQFSILEWRLLAPSLRPLCESGKWAHRPSIIVIGPAQAPHPPGLRHEGIDERQLIWIQAETPAERLWATEQLLKSNAFGALVAWLPQVRHEQIRRLQVLSAQCKAPVFLVRPITAASESSAAPLRVLARVDPDWCLQVDILKRKGPPLDETLQLSSVPAGLQSVITARLRQPSLLFDLVSDHSIQREAIHHAVGRAAVSAQTDRFTPH